MKPEVERVGERSARPAYLLVDGTCRLCLWMGQIVRRLQNDPGLRVVPFQQLPERALRDVGLDYQRCAKQISAITGEGAVLQGAEAVNFAFAHTPLRGVASFAARSAPFFRLEERVYKFINRHRHLLSKFLPSPPPLHDHERRGQGDSRGN